MRVTSKPQGKAMYVASELDKSWLLSEQRKLHKRSQQEPDYVFRKLWGLVTDPRNLRVAFARVASNRGRRTAGVDGLTVRSVLEKLGVDAFVEGIRVELRSRAFRPSPVRRVLIPKPGQPGKSRPLGIPTVKDRVVQAAMKNILEPIFEADFFPCSYGFRPGRGAHAALEELRKLLLPQHVKGENGTEVRFPYPWAIEGDIKGCFDNIDHHGLMERVRQRVGDAKVNRLVVAFLKAGVLSGEKFLRSDIGTPQGGILSPLLANIALSVIDERYERHVWPRRTPTLLHDKRKVQLRALSNRNNDRRGGLSRGRPVFVPVRYADDFIILVGVQYGPGQDDRAREAALAEKAALAKFLKETLNLELSEEKTLVTPVTKPLRFLGHHVRVQRHPYYGWCSKAVIPKDRSRRFRVLVKRHLDVGTRNSTLKERLELLNPFLRGWSNFYRHAWGAKRVFGALDSHVWWAIRRWLKKKHYCVGMRELYARYGWRKPGGRMWRWHDGGTKLFELVRLRVERYRHAWMKTPNFAKHDGEPGA
jgi:RNA-directed DNA polymerase